jgi:hypothetical protein
MTQTMYAHVNKCIIKNLKKKEHHEQQTLARMQGKKEPSYTVVLYSGYSTTTIGNNMEAP